DGKWLYPVPLAAGGKGILFKTLLSNACSSDCRYCPLRHDGNARRCTLQPEEVAKAFTDHLRKQWLLGLFLSSGIQGNADQTMEKLIASADILRRKYQYRGYIHLKVIPGASEAAIDEALRLSSAVSLNIEVPGRKHFQKLSAYKDFDRDIVRPLKYIAAQTAKGMRHERIKTSTQFIVGASDENDREIITYLDGIYNRLKMDRAYFSAYQEEVVRGQGSGVSDQWSVVSGQSERGGDLLTREHRLYQADFLLRRYHFEATELVYDERGHFDLTEDPKLTWAKRHPERFPVPVATADRETLLRVPGLGPTYVHRILSMRRLGRIASLADIGVRGKNADKVKSYCLF
ncbi:MAG: radical SAM protein, partial [Kiritimatiellaeota bacterium]|nr:radical SAM protein [Kiritimatiellota bacterium]